jgi:hypothetical protein
MEINFQNAIYIQPALVFDLKLLLDVRQYLPGELANQILLAYPKIPAHLRNNANAVLIHLSPFFLCFGAYNFLSESAKPAEFCYFELNLIF